MFCMRFSRLVGAILVHRLFCLTLLPVVWQVVLDTKCPAADLQAPFLQGLREQGYFDLALSEVDRMSRQSSDAAGLLTLQFERGQTLGRLALVTSDMTAREQRLEAAVEDLRAFMRRAPRDARANAARQLLAELLIDQSTRRLSGEFRATAMTPEQAAGVRIVVDESREYLQQIREQLEEQRAQFPVYLPEDQVVARASRRAIDERLIRTQLDLAQCLYWKAHTWPPDSDESRRLCGEAGLEFDAIHQRYRSQLGGLFARLWQGRCFQEQGNEQGIRIALGIYSEILDHDGDSASLTNLKDRALCFRLVCLNSAVRKDYQLVIQEGTDWLSQASERSTSSLGQAVQWEVCLALESKAEDPDLTLEERLELLVNARDRALALQHFSTIYGVKAITLLRRVTPALEEAGR
jgi:hypothetical protein